MPLVETAPIDEALAEFDDRRLNLIPILQQVQATYSYLPQAVLRRVSHKLRVPLAEIYQVATFYRSFSLTPRGKHVLQVCLGTACHVRGAPKVLDRMLRDLKLPGPGTTEDLQFTVETVRCIGCCGLAPVVRADGNNTHPHLTQTKVPGLLKKYRRAEASAEASPTGRG
jgi:NADH-quinone oxidoreductase subunit E